MDSEFPPVFLRYDVHETIVKFLDDKWGQDSKQWIKEYISLRNTLKNNPSLIEENSIEEMALIWTKLCERGARP